MNKSIILDLFRRSFCGTDEEKIKTEKFTYEDPYFEPARHDKKTFMPSANANKIVFQLQASCDEFLIKYAIFKEIEITFGLAKYHECTLKWDERFIGQEKIKDWCPHD